MSLTAWCASRNLFEPGVESEGMKLAGQSSGGGGGGSKSETRYQRVTNRASNKDSREFENNQATSDQCLPTLSYATRFRTK